MEKTGNIKTKINSVKETSDRIDIDMDVILPGVIREIQMEFSLSDDPFEGKAVCAECKFYPFGERTYKFCLKSKKTYELNFIKGIEQESVHQEFLLIKNENGDCPDFVSRDPYKQIEEVFQKGCVELAHFSCRMDDMIRAGHLRLHNELADVVDDIKEKVAGSGWLLAEAFQKFNDIPTLGDHVHTGVVTAGETKPVEPEVVNIFTKCCLCGEQSINKDGECKNIFCCASE